MSAQGDLADTQVRPQVNVRFVTKRFVFKSLLDKAMVVLPTTDVVGQVLKNFQIEVTGGDEPRLRTAATDLDLWALASSSLVEVEGEGAMLTLPGVKALEIAEAATDDELEIVADNGVATITVGRTTWELRLPDGSDYPPFPDVDNIGFVSVDRSRFAAALAAVRHAATAESMRQNLMMVDISGGRMRASDGVRYHQVTMPGWPDDFDTHIPIGAVEVLLKLLRSTEIEALEIADTDDQIVFRLGADVFVASKLVVAFPNVDQMLLEPAMGNDQHLVVDRTSLEGAIKRVRITADPETMAVALTMDPDHVTVRSQDKYGNTCSEVIDAQWSGDAGRTAAFNHSHLSDLVASVDTRSCSFALGKDTKQRLSPLLLRDDSSGVLGVLTQQRIDWVM